MRFMGPAQFIRMNEAADDEEDLLDSEWEASAQAARAHYGAIKDRLPPKLAEFIAATCVHDAEWMGLSISSRGNGGGPQVAVANLRLDDDVLSLVYDLYEPPQWSDPIPSTVWTDDEHLICLYDEIDLMSDAKFSHEILLSNGRVVRFVFFQFDFHTSHSVPALPAAALPA